MRILTYTFKTIILRLLEIYENNSDTYDGRLKFFQAWAFAYIYNSLVNKKKFNSKEIKIRNVLMYNWRNAKDPLRQHFEIMMKTQIEDDYRLIASVIDSIKDSEYRPIMEYQIERQKVAGCIGTVVY